MSGLIKRRKGGQKPHVPTPEAREKVRILKMAGLTDEHVARILGISADTLVRHYRADVEDGRNELLREVTGTLYRKALAGDVTACIFILKTRAGWSERVEVSAEMETNVRHGVIVIPAPFSTYEEWAAALAGGGGER